MNYVNWLISRINCRYFRLAGKIIAGKIIPVIIKSSTDDEYHTDLKDGNAILSGPRIFFANSRLFSERLQSTKVNFFTLVGRKFFHPEEVFFRNYHYGKIRFLLRLSRVIDALNMPILYKKKKYIDSGIVAFSEYNFNYYHFLIETIPAILRAEKTLISPSPPKNHSIEQAIFLEDNLHDNFYELADLNSSSQITRCPSQKILISRSSTIMANAMDKFYCRDLHLSEHEISKIEATVNVDVETLKEIRSNMYNKFLSKDEIVLPLQDTVIYIPRRKDQLRSIINEHQLLAQLPDHKLTPFDHLSVREQVRQFALNKTIIAGSGAYLANLIFANKHSTIIILHSDHPNVIRSMAIWKCLQVVSGCQIFFVSGPRIHIHSPSFSRKIHSDFSIHPDDFMNALSSGGVCTKKEFSRQ